MRHPHANCLKCYANGRHRANYPGHYGYRRPRAAKDTVMGLLRKQSGKNANPPVSGTPPIPESWAEYPALWEFLTSTVWDEDMSPREPGTVMLFSGDGLLKAMLNDKDASKVAFAVLDPDQGVLGSLDAMLLSTSTDWRAAKKMGAPRK